MINKEGEKERIDHRVNKNWKIGGDVHAPMEDKLKFLCNYSAYQKQLIDIDFYVIGTSDY